MYKPHTLMEYMLVQYKVILNSFNNLKYEEKLAIKVIIKKQKIKFMVSLKRFQHLIFAKLSFLIKIDQKIYECIYLYPKNL